MQGLAVLVAATISTLSLCRTKTDPAVTISDLSSVVLVTWYSVSSFFWMAAFEFWSSALRAEGVAMMATSTASTPLDIAIVLMRVSPRPLRSTSARLAVCTSGKTVTYYTPARLCAQYLPSQPPLIARGNLLLDIRLRLIGISLLLL